MVGTERLEVVMQKTKGPNYLPLSNQALKWMPERGDKMSEEYVFDLPSTTHINILLKPWAKAAGIDKHFTFHTDRHTFATMMLTTRSGFIYDVKTSRTRRCKDDAGLCKNRQSQERRSSQSCEQIVHLESRKNGFKKSLVYKGGHI